MRTARYLAMAALLLSTISCAGPQSVELSVDRAVATLDRGGGAAIEVFLTVESARTFAALSSRALGRVIEFRFFDKALAKDRTLAKALLLSPFLDGHFYIGASPNRIDESFSEDNAAEIARKLSSGNAKLEVRVVDEGK